MKGSDRPIEVNTAKSTGKGRLQGCSDSDTFAEENLPPGRRPAHVAPLGEEARRTGSREPVVGFRAPNELDPPVMPTCTVFLVGRVPLVK